MRISLIACGVTAGLFVGCTTCHHDEPLCEHERLSKTETYVWSSDQVSQTVYPDVQGPVDTYRPIYKLGDKKYSSKGVGETDKQAVANAIYNMCNGVKCDYVAAAKCLIKKTVDDLNGTSCEAELIGYPVYITGMEVVKPRFYEQQTDGSMKEVPLEHRYVLTTNLVWKAAVLDVPKGNELKADTPAMVSRTLKKVRTCEKGEYVKLKRAEEIIGEKKADQQIKAVKYW